MIWIKFTDIKTAVNKLLMEKYPDYEVYGKEIREGYITPSFFTEIIDKGSKGETKNFASGGFTVKITYFQDEKKELDQLKKVDEIKDLFGLIFCVEGRRLVVGEYTHEYTGEYSDILQISIDFSYKEYSGLTCQDNFSSNLSLGGKHTFL